MGGAQNRSNSFPGASQAFFQLTGLPCSPSTLREAMQYRIKLFTVVTKYQVCDE